MKALRIAVLSLLLIAANASAASVYRCTVNGRVAYKDTPCAGAPASQNVQHIAAPVASQSDLAAPIQTAPAGVAPVAPVSVIGSATGPLRQLPERPNSEARRKARMASQVMLGMTESDVLEVAGKYSDHETASGADANGQYEIWTFRSRQEGFPLTVAFRQGTVVQFSSGDLPYLSY